MRTGAVVASVLSVGALLLVRPAAAESSPAGGARPTVALGTGVYVFVPYLLVVQDVSAEIVIGDRVAIGGSALFPLANPSEVLFAPFVF
jgi:hypothetical protein